MLKGAHVLFCRRCSQARVQRRALNLQEYQSKALLREHGCIVQNFFVTDSIADAKTKIKNTSFAEYVVKSQILAGGRGKGQIVGSSKNMRGIFISSAKDDVLESIEDMLNKRLVTKQTVPKGILVKKVMVAESINILRETYLAILVDSETHGPVIIASPSGGMDIEELAVTQPELILKEPINIETGVLKTQCEKVARFLRFPEKINATVAQQIQNLYSLFVTVDATLIEINPFAETADHKVYCVDAKLNFDDNAAFRQKEIFALQNVEEELNEHELEAKKRHLNYIGLDGDIACLVNGAGLAMATMDIIKLFGGRPANFLDVGGGVTEEQVFDAFRILTANRNVNAIFVNVFGGIINCVTIANALIKTLKHMRLELPVIVRLEGTNVDEAKRLLLESKFPFRIAHGLEEATVEVVDAASVYRNTAQNLQENKQSNTQTAKEHATCDNTEKARHARR